MLKAFADTQMSSTDMLGTTGYGLWDTGRAKLEQIFAQVMGAEDALVRSQFQSGTHNGEKYRGVAFPVFRVGLPQEFSAIALANDAA